jgi:colanic acid/amylovoran biosynthesis glycosyltransferase
MQNIAIYRRILLPPSETFILNQAEALQQFRPWYLGVRFGGAVCLPEERSFAPSKGGVSGRIRELWAGTRYVQNVLQSLQPAFVHAHFGPDGLAILPFAKSLGIPVVTTFHGYDATVRREHALKSSSFQHRSYARRMEVLQEQGTIFIAVSQFVCHKLLEQGFQHDKVRVHYIGVNTSELRSDPEIKRLRTVLFVGRLVENKGCAYLLEAMERVQRTIPDAELVVIGDGPQRRKLECAARSQLRRFRFLGAQPPHLVREWMQRSWVFCVPSVTIETGASEGFGLVFAEAQAMGLPVASFSTGGIPEAVAHGQTGLLAAERDVKALSDNVALLLTDAELWERFSSAGQTRARKLFDIQQQTLSLEKIYCSIVGDHDSTALTPTSHELEFDSAAA